MMPATQDEAFAIVNANLQALYPGAYCFVSTVGPAIVNQIATIHYPNGSTQPLDEYLAINPGVFDAA